MLVQQAKMRVRSATIDDLHRISPGNGPIILSIGNHPISSTNLGDFHYHDCQKVSTLTPETGFIDPRKTKADLSSQTRGWNCNIDAIGMSTVDGSRAKKNYHSLTGGSKQTNQRKQIN